jgi:hypothetical protein
MDLQKRDSLMATLLRGRRLVVCGTCGWIHYAMTSDEKARHDRALERYRLDADERRIYESEFRQCLRCESSASVFRDAPEREITHAVEHVITPVLL